MEVKIKIKNFKFFPGVLFFGLCFFVLFGCAAVKESAKGFAGISTKALEEHRKDAIGKQFNFDKDTCYKKTLEALGKIGAYVYAKDLNKYMIAIYVSETDTTAVGLFFKEVGVNSTQIEVSSVSTYGKEWIAKKVFSALEGKPEGSGEEGSLDAKK